MTAPRMARSVSGLLGSGRSRIGSRIGSGVAIALGAGNFVYLVKRTRYTLRWFNASDRLDLFPPSFFYHLAVLFLQSSISFRARNTTSVPTPNIPDGRELRRSLFCVSRHACDWSG